MQPSLCQNRKASPSRSRITPCSLLRLPWVSIASPNGTMSKTPLPQGPAIIAAWAAAKEQQGNTWGWGRSSPHLAPRCARRRENLPRLQAAQYTMQGWLIEEQRPACAKASATFVAESHLNQQIP